MSSAAELALKKKFALLAKKKQEAAGGGGSAKGGHSASGSGAAGAAAAQDPGRLAAIRALQAKRAEAGAKAAAPPAAAASPADAPAKSKVRLVIPKREVSAAAPAPAAAGGDPARAAALAALRAKAAQGQPSPAAQAAAPSAAVQQQQEQPKRPALRRPSARPRPTQQQQSAAADAGPGGDDVYQQQQQQHADEPGSFYGIGDAGDEQAAKRQRLDHHPGDDGDGGADRGDGGATLFVGDLPPSWGTAQLFDFFNSEFGEVLEARVIGSQCYGFVSFASAGQAEELLEFAQQQGVWAEERMLRINWAQGSMPEWKKGPATQRGLEPGEGATTMEAYEHPRVKEARLQAQQLAASVDAQQVKALAMQPPPERALVSYEDL